MRCGAQCEGHDSLSSRTPRRIKRSAVEQQAASINLNGLVPFMALSETKQTDSYDFRDALGRGCIAESWSSRWRSTHSAFFRKGAAQRDAASEFPPLSLLPHPPHRRMLSCLFFDKINPEHHHHWRCLKLTLTIHFVAH